MIPVEDPVTSRVHDRRVAMAKVMCVLYDDPVTVSDVYARDEIPG